jgi:hypothetical protein
MYQRPTLKRFGSLRELTAGGYTGETDGWFLLNAPAPVTGCDLWNDGRNCS